jgi:ribosomal protein S11
MKWAKFAVNSRGEIILLDDDKITVNYSTGERKDVMLPDRTESNVVRRRMDVAVDSNDNVYAVRRLATRDKNSSYKEDFVLYAFDENYDMKQVSVLDFLVGRRLRYMDIAVDKNQNLIMFTDWNDQVCICENTGKLKFQFKQHGSSLCSLSISNNNDIMVVSDDHRAVQVYSTEGNLKSTMKVPEDHEARRVAFHHGICKIFVLTYVWKQHSCFLLGYSQAGELENSVFFRKGDPQRIDMKSHPSGPVAVAADESITLI